MTERWGDSQRDRAELDAWITRDSWGAHDGEEYDPPCPNCGLPCSDHPTIQVTDADGNDYETQTCP